MQTTLVTSKGHRQSQTIREALGIQKGSEIKATIVGDHIELHIIHTPFTPPTGFAMLKSKRTAVPTDFDPASLLNDDRA